MPRVYKEVEVEIDLELSDFSDEEIIEGVLYRDLVPQILDRCGDADEDVPFIADARRIVQKHRSGQEWQADALELLYNMANKIV